MKLLKALMNIASLMAMILFVIVIVFLFFFTEALMVVSGSMKPFLSHGDRFISLKLSYPQKYNSGLPFPLKRQDVVVINDANYHENIVKRIIGLPGETIEMRDNKVFVDSKLLEEPYAVSGESNDYQSYQVPLGKVFLLGDNRSRSRDSREFGFVDISQIKGKLILCFYPIDRFRFFYPF